MLFLPLNIKKNVEISILEEDIMTKIYQSLLLSYLLVRARPNTSVTLDRKNLLGCEEAAAGRAGILTAAKEKTKVDIS